MSGELLVDLVELAILGYLVYRSHKHPRFFRRAMKRAIEQRIVAMPRGSGRERLQVRLARLAQKRALLELSQR